MNKARQLICAVFSYGVRPSTYALPSNPAQHADRRREPDAVALAFYSPEQIETLARALADGAHRDPSRPALSPTEIAARVHEDAQDAELIRVAAYAGLRRGELVALRWRDVDFGGRKIIVRRALSGETEVRSTKSRRARQVPLPDQAAAALERLSRRGEFTGPDDYVFANRLGRRLDPSALRRRFERARDAAGLEPLRFHDLRHTYGSLLVAGGIDLPSVKARWATRTSGPPSATCTPGRRRAGGSLHASAVGVGDPAAPPPHDEARSPPDGHRSRRPHRRVQRRACGHIMVERPQLLGDVDAIIGTIGSPEFRETDPIPGRERFYRRRVTAKVRWLRVVVDFNQEPAVVGNRLHPAQRPDETTMSIMIGGIEFDHHSYDGRGDVLYLSIGEPPVPAERMRLPKATPSTSTPTATSSAWCS